MLHTKKHILPALLLLLNLATAQCASENNSFGPDLIENNTQTGDSGTFFPNTDGSTDPATNICGEDAADDCTAETGEDPGPLVLNFEAIDFGLSEINAIECRTLSIPAGLSFAVEFDKNNTATTTEGSEDNLLFSFLDPNGQYTQSRLEGSEEFSVCYMRSAQGSHTGIVKLMIGGDAATPAAFVIPVQGSTLEPFFTITAPQQNEVYYDCPETAGAECTSHHAGRNDAEGDYLIAVSGRINLELVTILKDGYNTPITIDADGVKYRATFDETGYFEKTIGLPQTPGLYNITFSVETNKSSEIKVSIPVIVAAPPTLEIEIRDSDGNEINTTTPTDTESLIIGLRIPNLDLSGAGRDQGMAVTLANVTLNEVPLITDQEIWYESGASWCTQDGGITGQSYPGFAGETTFCVPTTKDTGLQQGLNVITATAKNQLGETTAQATLIIDYNKPIIRISSPKNNALKRPGISTITVAGVIKNFAPLDTGIITPDKITDDDTGSYCQPQSENDSTCPKSNIRLWFNTTRSDNNYPIYIYPEYLSEGQTLDELNQEIFDNPDTRGNCKDTTPKVCNIPEGRFSITLTVPSDDHHARINLYTNILQFWAESISGHVTIKVVTFQTGFTNTHTVTHEPESAPRTATLTAGSLGHLKNDQGVCNGNCVSRAPFMLNLSEGIIERYSSQTGKLNPVIKIVEDLLNDNLKFADLANGWPLPENAHGEIDLLAKFKEQYKKEQNKDFDFFAGLEYEYQEKFIHQGIHKMSMAEKYLALRNYRIYRVLRDQCDPDNYLQCYFEQFGDPQEDYNVAIDACGETITTAFVPLKDIQHVARAVWPDENEHFLIPISDEWPEIAGTDLNFDDWTQGKWHVDKLDLKENGKIDAEICLVPGDVTIETCDDDVTDAETPAFWGHLVAYNLIEGGLLGQQETPLGLLGFNDPTMPIIWSLGKLRLKLNDVVSLKKTGPQGGDKWPDGTDEWINSLEIDGSKIISGDIDVTDPAATAAVNSIFIEPFANCRAYYEKEWKKYKGSPTHLPDNMIPFGCNVAEDSPLANYPVIIERNSVAGTNLVTWLADEGRDTVLLSMMWRGIQDTFKKIISCADTEMVNPMIDPKKFPHPQWVWADDPDKINLDFEWEDFNFSANVQGADLNIFDGGITARLPLELGVDGVSSKVLNPIIRSLTSFENESLTGKVFDLLANTEANKKGHLVRGFDNLDSDDYPLTSEEPHKQAFASLSVNIEEILNSVFYLLFKKGPLQLLDTFDVNELKPTNDWRVGIDKVVLGRFDICNIGGQVPTEFDIFFSSISSQFDYPSLHFDLILDPNYPPTISLNDITQTNVTTGATTLVENASEIQLGLTNIQIAVKELIPEAGLPNVYLRPDSQPEVLRVRLDAVLSLKAIYHPSDHKLKLFIEDFDKQNIHLSVPEGHGGANYSDFTVVEDILSTVIKDNLFNKIKMEFNSAANATASMEISLPGNPGAISAIALNDIEATLNGDLGENGSCEGNVPHYSDEMARTATLAPGSTLGWTLSWIAANQQVGQKSKATKQAKPTPKKQKKKSPVASSASYKSNPLQTENCDALYPDSGEDNPIAEALCDIGIKDIEFSPTIIFDNDNGYIHVSTELMIKLQEWLGGD